MRRVETPRRMNRVTSIRVKAWSRPPDLTLVVELSEKVGARLAENHA
ncbi:hypothetical protein [Thermogladius sp.]